MTQQTASAEPAQETTSVDRRTPDATPSADHLKKIKPPSANPGSVYLGLLSGVALLALAAIALRDLIVKAGWVDGSGWLANAFGWFSRLTWQSWMWVPAVALVIVGLGVLWVAVKPRRTTHVQVYANTIWTRRVDLARRASAAARGVDGVETASTLVKRNKAKVSVGATDDDPGLPARVRDAVDDALAHTGRSLRVVVRTRVSTPPANHTPTTDPNPGGAS
ncbi:DUF6286 domain-containing protein [Williamsia sterculiae]|uniref:DUF6286 domain-containing protein n=1 Tax=Williamsia sterculiae TaxID=1344003 RepID=A0A1N7HC32_9NOCA|nr:DUF6286 domain-containing protein [Williamsia sterculiae]SIS22439.1 hypothetical protein SAMN05445060_3949 [Williamsia sterculiae]